MSELKVYVHPLKTNIIGQTIVGQSYYLKSEADKRNFDVFTLTIDVDGDESDVEVIKEPYYEA